MTHLRTAVLLFSILALSCCAPIEVKPFHQEGIRLTAGAGAAKAYRSNRFAVAPGHYDAVMAFRASGLELSAERPLERILQVKLRVFDKGGREINQKTAFRGTTVDGSILTAAFKGVTDSSLIPAGRAAVVHLVPQYYPFDSGWIPADGTRAEFEITVLGPGDLTIEALDFHRSKWNETLQERISGFRYGDTGAPPVSTGESTPIRAANSQGAPELQLAYLKEALPRLPLSSINSICIEVGPADLKTAKGQRSVAELLKLLGSKRGEAPGFSFGVSYNPYWLNRDTWEAGQISLSDPKTLSKLKDSLRPYLRKGASYLLLRSDDLAPKLAGSRSGYYLSDAADQKKFSSLAAAHAAFINSVRKYLKAEYPRTKLFFVPPWYSSVFLDDAPNLALPYFNELSAAVPEDVGFLWTGPAVRSLIIDELPAGRYEAAVHRKNVLLWDNSLYARRHNDYWRGKSGRARFSSYFEPYETEIFPGYVGRERPFVFINGDLSPIGTIQYAVAGSYFAAPASYVPERSLWSYLAGRMGERAAAQLLEFDGLLMSYLDRRAAKAPKGELLSMELKLRNLLIALRAVKSEGPLWKQLQEILDSELPPLIR